MSGIQAYALRAAHRRLASMDDRDPLPLSGGPMLGVLRGIAISLALWPPLIAAALWIAHLLP